MEREEVCYTRDGALQKGIEMENHSFEMYRSAFLKARDLRARDLLKELALDELEHKHRLEKALFEDMAAFHDPGMKEAPSMRFSMLLEKRPLQPDSDMQEAMIYAVHEEKRAVDFYRNMSEQCRGAPMQDLFTRLYLDEEKHLARLEEVYEDIYMKEM